MFDVLAPESSKADGGGRFIKALLISVDGGLRFIPLSSVAEGGEGRLRGT